MRYIGSGRFLAGIPARDLTPQEVKEFGFYRLIKSGLYEEKYIRKPKQVDEPVEETIEE